MNINELVEKEIESRIGVSKKRIIISLRYRLKRKYKGVCIDCAMPLSIKSSYYCDKHLERSTNSSRLVREKNSKSGKCRDCGKEKQNERIRCVACLKRQMDYNYFRRKSCS